jgi:cephalosporin-C deacetylase-like acetyl esterase
MRVVVAVAALLVCLSPLSAQDKKPADEKGIVKFAPVGDQKEITKQYRLDAHEFPFDLKWKKSLEVAGVDIFDLTFPSPVKTEHVENNTVWAEYYRPRKPGPHPGVIVLDITGGNQQLSRMIATHFAQTGVAGLFVQMAYYGPRRPANSKLRLMSYDIEQTIKGVEQTVLDLRRATAWMESRPELDPKRLGIMGTSLGSFLAALTAEMEPKLGRVAVLLGGGGFVDAYWEHPQVLPFRQVYETVGGTKQSIKDAIASIDPITAAGNLKNRRVLIIGAKKDEIVPPAMAENLWKATGEQRIIWLNAGHYSAAVFLIPGLKSVSNHFLAE